MFTGGSSLFGTTTLPVKVIVLRLPGSSGGSGADDNPPYADKTIGTLPIDSSGDVTLAGTYTLATSLTEADIADIFEQVNVFYAPTGIVWEPNVTFVAPTVPCGAATQVCGKYKCRTHDYFVKYFGSVRPSVHRGPPPMVPSARGPAARPRHGLDTN